MKPEGHVHGSLCGVVWREFGRWVERVDGLYLYGNGASVIYEFASSSGIF